MISMDLMSVRFAIILLPVVGRECLLNPVRKHGGKVSLPTAD